MKLHELSADDDAVSPVIGVILMVAITVILAAVIGTFVLGLGSDIQSNPPSAQFTFSEDSSGDLTITHDGGQPVDVNNLNVTGGDLDTNTTTGTGTKAQSSCQHNEWGSDAWSDDELGAGDSCTISSGNITSGEEIRVTWASDSGDSTSTLAGPYEYDS